MKVHALLGSLFGAALLATTGSAAAGTKIVNLTLDLNAQCITCDDIASGPGFTQGPFSVDLAIGDTLDLTVDFLDDQQLTVTNLRSIFPSIWTNAQYNNPSNITQSGMLSFLNSLGSVIYTSPLISKTEPLISRTDGGVHAGQFVDEDELPGLPSTFTFSSVRWLGTVDSYDGVITTRNYTSPGFYVGVERTLISNSGAVPEPATWAMMIIGFGAAGSMIRRRKAVVA